MPGDVDKRYPIVARNYSELMYACVWYVAYPGIVLDRLVFGKKGRREQVSG